MSDDRSLTGSGACIEAEVLAAFVDGRLDGEDRDRVLAHLDECEECFEIVAGAAAVEEELTAEELTPQEPEVRPDPRFGRGPEVAPGPRGATASDETPQKVVPIGRRSKRWYGLLPAAAMIALLAIPGVRETIFGPNLGSSAQLVGELVSLRTAVELNAAAFDDSEWTRLRSDVDGLDERSRSFRLGVRSMNFEVSLAAGDRAQAIEHLRTMLLMIRGLEISEAEQRAYAALDQSLEDGASLSEIATRSRELEPDLVGLSIPGWYELGRDLEAARLAAEAGTLGPFDGPAIGSINGVGKSSMPEKLVEPLHQLQSRLANPDDGTSAALASAIGEFLSLAGNR